MGANFSDIITYLGSRPSPNSIVPILVVIVLFLIYELFKSEEIRGLEGVIRSVVPAVLLSIGLILFSNIAEYVSTRFTVVGPLVLGVIIICAVGIGHGIYTSVSKIQTTRTWQLTEWEIFKENWGKWKVQPTLIVEGKSYTYQTPQQYIDVLRRLKEKGFPGAYESTIAALENIAPYFDSAPEVAQPSATADPVQREDIAASFSPPSSSPDIAASHPPPIPQEPSKVPNPSHKVKAMQLKIRRSQRTGGITGGKVLFAIDARVEPSTGDTELIRKYKLGGSVVYDSAARRQHSESAATHAEATRGASAAGIWYRVARASISAAAAALSLRVTIDSLISGVHIECKDLDELIGAEAAIVEACQTVKEYLGIALTFDGREEVVEF